MISPEAFYKQVNDNFKIIFKKMDDLHGETKDDIEKLSEKIGETDEKLNTHLKVGEELDKYKKGEEKKAQNKKRRYVSRCILYRCCIILQKMWIGLALCRN